MRTTANVYVPRPAAGGGGDGRNPCDYVLPSCDSCWERLTRPHSNIIKWRTGRKCYLLRAYEYETLKRGSARTVVVHVRS